MSLRIVLQLSGIALRLRSVAASYAQQCSLSPTPPAGKTCGVIGYLSNEESYDAVNYDPAALTVLGCALSCALRPTCVSWYFGREGSAFCEWHTAPVVEAGFYPNSDSYYYAYDQACFNCGPADLTCPNADGQQFTAGASVFNIHCGMDYYGGDLNLVQTATFTDCLVACASTAGCMGVAYNGNNCYLKNVISQPQKNANVWGAVLASAEDAYTKRLSCPQNDGAIYTTKSGDTYTVQCGVDYYGGDLSSLRVDSLEACLEACDTTPGCLDIAMHGSYCYLKNTVTSARQNENVWGAIKNTSKQSIRRRADVPETAKNNPYLQGNSAVGE